jgi:predicted AAA+ superfamily ATPase
MNLEELKKFENELLPSQYKAFIEIVKYLENEPRIIILSGFKGSGKTFLLNFLQKNVYCLNENNLIKNNNYDDIPDYSLFTVLRDQSLIFIDQGGLTKEWFRNLMMELEINKIKTAIVSSNLSSSTEIPVVRIEINQDDTERFLAICWQKDINIKENINSQNLWDFIY